MDPAIHIDIITCLPRLLDSPLGHSIMQRAQDKKIAEVVVHDLRDYSENKHKQVDDYAFGGGAGMVMMIEPIAKCIETLSQSRTYDAIMYMTPDGKRFDQPMANQCSMMKNIIILCGHYKGVDERVRQQYITHEISIGDYVISGGELAAAIIVDAIVRLVPGVLNDETSALTDSFQDNLLAPPVYTRPADFKGLKVPDILLSGDLKAIDQWRQDQAYERTKLRRPDLLDNAGFSID